jgi:hypothetical protein
MPVYTAETLNIQCMALHCPENFSRSLDEIICNGLIHITDPGRGRKIRTFTHRPNNSYYNFGIITKQGC